MIDLQIFGEQSRDDEGQKIVFQISLPQVRRPMDYEIPLKKEPSQNKRLGNHFTKK